MPLSPRPAATLRGTVSLRLGHAAVLTSHCDVIHFRVAATLPTGEGERLQTQPNNITR